MKKYYRLLVIFLLFGCLTPHIALAQVVNVPDPNLAEALRGALGLAPNAPITRQDVQRLGGFLAVDTQIRNLTGLEHATQLERLDLRSNQISDLTPLAELTQLEVLILANNQISNISTLAGLTRLRVLALDGNQVSNLAPLARLTQLERLFLVENQVSNLTPLRRLTQLERLDIWNNRISDVSPLAGLTQLKWLDLDDNQISDVRPLAELTQLDVLFLHGNKIRDMRPLAGLTQLKELFIGSNQIRDVSPLTGMTQLVGLGLNNNQIQNIRPLDRLTGLRRLFLSLNQISNVNPLAGLTQLRELWLIENNIRDVSPLAKLVNLEKLRLARNPITDTSPLASLTKLVEVDVRITAPPTRPVDRVAIPDPNLAAAVRETLGLAANAPITEQAIQGLTTLDAGNRQITDLTGLEHATQLTELRLQENQVRDISQLKGLKRLSSLELWNNQIRDISPLVGLTNLTELLLNDNQIRDFTPIARLTKLRALGLGQNKPGIRDITPLRELTQIVWLNLYVGQIRDISPLAELTQLESLYLERNQVSDVNPLAGLIQLKDLRISENNIRDVSPLAGLVNLEKLRLAGNPIQDTSPLASLTKLVEVDIEIWSPVVRVESRDYPPMYWVNTVNDFLYSLTDTEVENPLLNVRNATSLAIDVGNEKVYWTEKTGNRTGRIRRANLDGTNVQLVKNLTSTPHSIALDTAADKIYLTNGWGKIQRLNIDGSKFEPNLITELDTPGGLALDVAGGKVYWTEASGRIRRANLDGSNVENIATGLANPLNIATSGNTIYWTEKTGENSGEIRFVNLRGTSNVRSLHSFSQGFPIGIAIDAVENKLYWTTSRGGAGRSNLDGTNFQPNFVTGLIAPGAFALNVEPKVEMDVSVDASVDVLIYTGDVWWITRSEAIAEAETTKRLLQSADIQSEITDNENTVKQWMLQTASDGSVDVLILYGLIPTTIYPPGNAMPNGSVAENWIETRDGNTILNHADYFGYWSTGNINQDGQVGVQNGHGTLQNLMDIPSIAIPVSGGNIAMFVATDGTVLTPSLVNFQSDRPFPLNQLQGDWFAEKIFASNTGDARATLADPIIVRDGDRGRIAIVHQTLLENNPKGEVAAEIIINYLFVDAVVSISPSSLISPSIGDQLTFNLNITAGEAVAGYQGTVQFDPTALRYVESNNGDYLPAGAFFVPQVVNGNGVKLAATALTGVNNGDGTLATLTFEVIAAKASTLTLTDVLLADSDGDTVSPQVKNGQITEPEKVAEDVNSDGVVNIQDLVLVASNFGQMGANAADVNGDGVVNITDLVKVAGALGNAAAAPSLPRQALAMFTTADVRQWLTQAQHLHLTDAASLRGIRFLEQLLTVLIPKETVLLPNYPNPFNPETWIPYQLAKPADVTLTIYGVDGKVVRRLVLGHQLAGTYRSKGRAAYWDGNNGFGEPVASGIYFYTFTAGDFTVTRKMLIRK